MAPVAPRAPRRGTEVGAGGCTRRVRVTFMAQRLQCRRRWRRISEAVAALRSGSPEVRERRGDATNAEDSSMKVDVTYSLEIPSVDDETALRAAGRILERMDSGTPANHAAAGVLGDVELYEAVLGPADARWSFTPKGVKIEEGASTSPDATVDTASMTVVALDAEGSAQAHGADRKLVVETPHARVEVTLGGHDHDGREIESVTVIPAEGCLFGGGWVVEPLPDDHEPRRELQHRLVGSQCDDVVYVVVMKRRNGDTPKVRKISGECFCMTRTEAEDRLAAYDDDVRGAYEVRAVYMTFAPAGV